MASKPTQRAKPTTAGLLRVSELSERAGVPLATIKFYIREGLLPPPSVIAGKNVGYYPPSLIERLTLIKKLREERFLPLRVIRAMVADAGKDLSPREADLIGDIKSTVLDVIKHAAAPSEPIASVQPMSRAEVLERFARGTADDLDVLEELGLLAPTGTGDERRYDEGDLRLLEAMHRSQAAGLSRELFPVESMGHYAEVIGELVQREIKIFARHTEGRLSSAELNRLAEKVLSVTEPVVVLVRRNLIRKALREVALPNPQVQKSQKASRNKKEKQHVG